MSNDIEFVSDGNGLAVLGDASEVDRFLKKSGLDKFPSKPLDLHRLRSAASIGGRMAKEWAVAADGAGRWVKLTKESAQIAKHSNLMKGSANGTSRAMAVGDKGIEHILQIVTKPGTALTNPAFVGGIGAVLSQYAMQQQMDEITEYIEHLDEKVDDILQNLKDAVLADMIGVDLVIEDALTIREEVGRVSEITWSKVQAASQTIARTQAYALQRLEAIAADIEKYSDVGDIAKEVREAERSVREWLAILARAFQLQEGVSVLELDRVLDSSPEEMESHRTGLLRARDNRLERIGSSAARLLAQMDETVHRANQKVLLNPFDSPAAVKACHQISTAVNDLLGRLGITDEREAEDAKHWGQAAGEVLEKARVGTTEGAIAAKRFGDRTLDRATVAFRSVDIDGDGIPDQPRAAAKAEEVGAALRGAASGVAGVAGSLFHRNPRAAELPREPEEDSSDSSDS
ncbi:hypothetical protein [Acidipropionibacterium acidipropionici]|jgi:hypothetical protein|uniref:hypothetical protein n=1 Tax=Acidipropionibacterium acidipropionici TaxID=1748 RepID=UPI00110A37CF|nr:hypothetical protein [Acidipropionibacterium acidipropionici]QCV96523.1 hypothetical protein FEZ30_15825 [Acidipropionibacterium acidipropionici]